MGLEDDMSGLDDMGVEDFDADIDVDMDIEDEGGSNEQVTFKTIQKLTGKLTQKIRTLENEEGLTSEDIKYVVNMVLSSFDLSELSEEDREDILSKFEDETEDLGGDDMDGEDLTDDSEVEDIQSDMDIPMESELDEYFYGDFEDLGDDEVSEPYTRKSSKGNKFGSFDNENWYDNDDVDDVNPDDVFDDEEFEKHLRHSKFKKRNSDYGNGAIFDSIFGESKVDKVLSKYFEISKKEIVENRQKTAEKKTNSITEVRRQMKSVIKLTETIEQELASQKFLEENSSAKIIGKTNKNNLVFENKGKEIKITPEGLLA
jgi:hypothetical protein